MDLGVVVLTRVGYKLSWTLYRKETKMSNNDSDGSPGRPDSYFTAQMFTLFANYGISASSALLWFDFTLTFSMEARHIWGRRKLSGITLVYVVTRYTAIIDRVFYVIKGFLWGPSYQTCGIIIHAENIMITLNYLGFSAFTIVGVYGVWGPDWKPLLVVAPLTLVKPALYIYETIYSVPSLSSPSPGTGCSYYLTLPLATASLVSRITTATTIAPNAILIILTWVKTFGIYKVLSRVGMRTSLTTLLLRDGTAYFIVLLLSRLVTIISNMLPLQPRSDPLQVFMSVWPYFDDVLAPIFISRFLLDVCSISFTDSRSHMGIPGVDSTTTLNPFQISEICFNASRVVGSLSATSPEASFNVDPETGMHPHELNTESVEWRDEVPSTMHAPFSDLRVLSLEQCKLKVDEELIGGLRSEDGGLDMWWVEDDPGSEVRIWTCILLEVNGETLSCRWLRLQSRDAGFPSGGET